MSARSLLRRFLWVGLTSFGAARWTNLYASFVRTRLISEADFMRDLAIAQTLPGAPFVNLTAHSGMRLGGWRMAVAALALVLLPGLVTIAIAMAVLTGEEPWVQRFFHGILIGAVGVLAGSLVQLSAARLRAAFDIGLAIGALLLVTADVPLVLVVLLIGAIGTLRYRRAEPAG